MATLPRKITLEQQKLLSPEFDFYPSLDHQLNMDLFSRVGPDIRPDIWLLSISGQIPDIRLFSISGRIPDLQLFSISDRIPDIRLIYNAGYPDLTPVYHVHK